MQQIQSGPSAAKKAAERGVATPKVETKGASKDFSKVMNEFLSGKESVSEEELFSAIARERIQTLKGGKEMKEYDRLISEMKTSSRDYEAMTKQALNTLVSNKKLSNEEANAIYSQSFAAAQLDLRKDVLWDDTGDTKAISRLSSALEKAKAALDGFTTNKPEQRDRSESPKNVSPTRSPGRNGQLDGRGGFFYVPFSSENGNLLVKAPGELTGNVDAVEIRDSSGRLLDSVKSRTTPKYGRNEIAMFKRSGSEYPQNITVSFLLKTGGRESFIIRDSSLTWD